MSCKNDETFTKILDMINAYADDIINEIYQIQSFEDMKKKIPNENTQKNNYNRIFASLWS